MSTLKLGSQVRLVADDRRGHVTALADDTVTVRLRDSEESVVVSAADVKTTRGRPAKLG